MDILRHFNTLAWCKPDWCFPSMSKETNELLMQCCELPTPEPANNLDDVIKKSKNFPIPFPIESVRLQKLRERRPLENLVRNIESTYPLIHERVLLLITHFIIFKREFGSNVEKALYKNMTIVEFVDRILTKRAISFFGKSDQYLLITGESNYEGWESVGTMQQKPPLLLENCLSYDEMKIAAMIFVSGHTEFINNGHRTNSGIISDDNIEKDGVIIGLIGTRLKRNFRMEYEDLLITEQQNSAENGYGEEVTPTTCLNVLKTSYVRNQQSTKHMWRQIWSEFFQVHYKTYEELTSYVNIQVKSNDQDLYIDRYVRIPVKDMIFDNEVYYKRLSIPFDCSLIEANERAKSMNKMAFLNVTGIGLGVWMVSSHQCDVFVLTFLERLRSFLKKDLLNNISDVNFAYIKPSPGILNMFSKKVPEGSKLALNTLFFESKRHPNGGVNVQMSNREPSSKLTGSHDGKLLVTVYAWDGNAHPGNEFWTGSLKSSGDPAAACSTQVAELHNAYINDRVSAQNLRVVSSQGLMSLQDYCKSCFNR